jgi:hypothetical protein
MAVFGGSFGVDIRGYEKECRVKIKIWKNTELNSA